MGQKTNMYVDIMALNAEVTGSCFLCVLRLPNRETVKFIVDCGLFQESQYEELNDSFPFNPETVQFVLVTHNHIDHIGRIPLLYKKGFNGKVYCTRQTKKLMPLALKDTYKILKDTYQKKSKKSLYSESNVDTTIMNTYGFEYNEKIELTPNITVTFLKNGHLFGSAMILLECSYPNEDTISVLFSGDYKDKNMFFDVPEIPKSVKNKRLTMFIESTYGTTDSSEVTAQFNQLLKGGVENKNTVVIPVFSLGRSQEVLLKTKKLQEKNEIDNNIPVYFDGKLAHNYTSILFKNREMAPKNSDFLPENIIFVNSTNRQRLLNIEQKKIIVTTSGMATHGPAQVYLPYFVSKEKAIILFTGYTAEGTLGRTLKEAKENDLVKMSGYLAVKRANIVSTSEFSAHAKADELIKLIKKFSNLRGVIVNHDDYDVKEAFAKRILADTDVKDVNIINRDVFYRIGAWGVIKSMTTKF